MSPSSKTTTAGFFKKFKNNRNEKINGRNSSLNSGSPYKTNKKSP